MFERCLRSCVQEIVSYLRYEFWDLNSEYTHSSKEASKEDEIAQELSLFDELTE